MARPATATSTICGNSYRRSDAERVSCNVSTVRSRPLITVVRGNADHSALVGVALTLADCGGSSSTSSSHCDHHSTNYTVGGTISGLTVSSVVLANGTATVTVSAGATTWVFPSSFAAGSSYSVTVQTQPAGELCEVTSGGSGMDTGDVGNVTVVCGFGQWTWEGGSNTVNASGVYGTQGTASASNVPGSALFSELLDRLVRQFLAVRRRWLRLDRRYGISERSVAIQSEHRTVDLDQRRQAANASGIYGTQGTASASNVPGARYAASSWIDSSGNLWLFGGVGYDSAGACRKSERSVAIQPEQRTVDLDQRRQRRQCQRGLRHPGHRRGQQCAGRALCGQLLDRLVRQPVVVRRDMATTRPALWET